MKHRLFAFAVSGLLLALAGYAAAQPSLKTSPVYIPDWNEELYGTWVNLDYAGNEY